MTMRMAGRARATYELGLNCKLEHVLREHLKIGLDGNTVNEIDQILRSTRIIFFGVLGYLIVSRRRWQCSSPNLVAKGGVLPK